MDDFEFQQIVPRCGGKREAFEDLCCQLAHRTLPQEAAYTRLWGAGGDGGVECFADFPDGHRVGWQAKYVFDIDALLAQATTSVTTALSIHSTLTHYILCFPFDMTGPTARHGRSGLEKFENWRKHHINKAASEGRQLTIEAWPASQLRSLLLDFDKAGGIRAFFFNHTILSSDWFSAHLDSAKVTAGPRYTPELNVETNLWKWFAAFGRTADWSSTLEKNIRRCRKVYDNLAEAVYRTASDPMLPAWPENSREDAQSLVVRMQEVVDELSRLDTTDDPNTMKQCVEQLDDALVILTSLESQLLEELEAQYGPGRADSPGFRQFKAEYEVSFPAANLDYVRETITACKDLLEWFRSPAGSLAFERAFVLTGAAGSGKTHGICDAAHQRFREGLLSCVIFGHTFRGEPDPWTRFLESLGLPITLGMDGLLDALNAAAEASGSLLIIFIDAINETRPLRYWRDRLLAFIQAVQRRSYLRLCVSCRTSFIPHCLPEGHTLPVIEHTGFSGIEREACKAFFRHYNLEPPVMPILQPELANPLYLKLTCETLHARGLNRLPSGWFGLAPVIRAFLDEKERQFADEHETNVGANIIGGSLKAIARSIVTSGDSSLAWSHAQQVIAKERPQASNLPILEWLVRADLLIEDAPKADDLLGDEIAVRPAFERLGDFLIATELMASITPTYLDTASQPGGPLHSLMKDSETVGQNSGVISALSILLPEQFSGLELPSLVKDEQVRAAALKITIESFPWRDPTSFSNSSRPLIVEGLNMRDFSYDAMDATLSIAWRPSTIDAIWLDGLLKGKPLPKRDAFWCGYLHNRYETVGGPVRHLIDAAFELPLDKVEVDVAERWATILLWFTAAADRRVKDRATRAVVALLVARPEVIPNILASFLYSDDDEVQERMLLSCYSALIVSRNTSVLNTITGKLHKAFRNNPTAFNNALIRDHIRCITELANELDVLPNDCDPELSMQPIGTNWPLDLPSDEEIGHWKQLPKLAHSCLHDDFYIYSMECLRQWEHAVPKDSMGKWILKRVAAGLGYEGSGCERYDSYMLGNYGGGRGREKWAERIGKKYQWIAMCQLASRLHDNVERKRDSWIPKPQRTPLILLEERKLDLTLPSDISDGEHKDDVWWIGSSADLDSGKELPDAEWVAWQEDLPVLEELLAVLERDGQRWQLLVSCPSWGRPDEDAGWNTPYRQVWVHVQSYVVPKNIVVTAYDCLRRRNFFGRWMPEGATWLYGFVGEYPWATPFNTEPEEWYGRGGHRFDLPVHYTPSCNQLAVEWEYDASLLRQFHMIVPARAFFSPRDLWWDGRDGYRLVDGRIAFRDPSVKEDGPAALIADADDLLERLNKIGLRLFWTLLGEKWILGGPHGELTPRRTFSQIARLEEDGSVEIGERVFFDNYDQDTGALPIKGKQRGRRRK